MVSFPLLERTRGSGPRGVVTTACVHSEPQADRATTKKGQ